MVEAKRRAAGKVKERAPRMTVVSEAVGTPVVSSFLPPGVGPGPDLKPRSPGLDPDQGWCKRCGEMTDQWYQRTLDQAKVRLCKRCKRESEAELAL